jgi:hypothetical protein
MRDKEDRMANERHRGERVRDRDRWNSGDETNRGAFGYEGEGYFHGGGRDVDRGDYGRSWTPSPSRPPRESHRGKGPKNYQRTDDRIREDVCEYLTEDDRLDASDIEVNVAEGVVILSGTVEGRGAKRRAEDIADTVGGVKDVRNQIKVVQE